MQVRRTPKTYRRLHHRLRRRRRHRRQSAYRGRTERRAARSRPSRGSRARLQRTRLALRPAASRRRRRRPRRAKDSKTNSSLPTAPGKSRASLTSPLPAPGSAGSARASSADAPTTGDASLCAWLRWISKSRSHDGQGDDWPSPTMTLRLTTTKSSPTSEFSAPKKIFPARPTEFSCRLPNLAAAKPSSRRPATICTFFAFPRGWRF